MGIVDLQKSAANALGFVVRRYTVGLSPTPPICDRLASTPEKIKIASGVLVRRLKKIYIVTADHFLETFPPEQVEVLFAPDTGRDGFVTGDASCAKLREEMKVADPTKMSMA